jgi:hypothetical protein
MAQVYSISDGGPAGPDDDQVKEELRVFLPRGSDIVDHWTPQQRAELLSELERGVLSETVVSYKDWERDRNNAVDAVFHRYAAERGLPYPRPSLLDRVVEVVRPKNRFLPARQWKGDERAQP